MGLKCFKEKKIIIIIFLKNFISLETFQSRRGYSIAIVDDGYVAASGGLKRFKEKNKKK
jgi:hypothetical protein